MSTLKFTEVHNLVAFLSKPTESKRFKQIMDFVNANLIGYTLTVNPTVDGKKVIIFKASIIRDLQFGDAEGVDGLPTTIIFEQLGLMSTIASAIICLATNQKFNFSKWIFESIGLSNHERKYVAPAYTRKSFGNMRRVGNESIADETFYKEFDDSLVRIDTVASSLEAEQDSGEDASKRQRISDIDADEDITLVSTHDDVEMFDADKDLHGEEVFVAKQDENIVEKEVDVAQVQVTTAATTTIILIDEVTLAQALSELASEKAQQQEEVNSALIEEWNDIQAKIDVDYLLA
nr:hypothetical protein [Tanacetum cinerariifolium]